MSKSLIKLVDQSLLPAALMVLGKFVGVIVTIAFFDIPWTFKDYTDSFLSVGTSLRAEDLVVVTTYSDLAMYAFLALGFTYIIIRAIYFHNSHIKPTLVTKLVNNNLFGLITSSYEVYHSAVVWLIFLWVGTLLVFSNIAMERSELWLGAVCFISSVVLTALLFRDVYKEIEHIREHPGEYKWS